MRRLVPRLAWGWATVLLATGGCEQNKKELQQDEPQAGAGYGLDYLEPAAPEQPQQSGGTGETYAAATEEGGTVSAGSPRVHIVQPKETLSSIAFKYYGTRNWRKIYEANRQRITDPNVIHPGMKLIIP